jgi:hypothetical protein
VFESDKEGPTTQVHGIVFKNGRYSVMIENVYIPVTYNIEKGYWRRVRGSQPLGLTTEKRWVELEDSSSYPHIKNIFITHEDYYRFIPDITLSENTKELPMVLNFVLTGEVPDKFLDRLKVFKKAFDESLIAEDRIFIFTAGQKATTDLFEKATTDLFEKAEESIMCLKIIDYNLMDGLPEFIEGISQYNSPHQSDLYSLLIRLKLSQQYRGIFLTPDNALPISIFREKLVVDETGVLLQTPIYKDSINQYVYPGNIFASLGTEGKTTLLLDHFLSNLKAITSADSNIGEYESIFTESVNYALLDYGEYLNYYKSANELNGDLYQLRYSGIKFTDNLNNYYGQLNQLLTKNSDKTWYTALKDNLNPSISLMDDPESSFLMQKFNVEIVKVNNEMRLMYPTNGDIRELYSFREEGSFQEPFKTGQLVYLDKTGVIEVQEAKESELLLDNNLNYHPPVELVIPIDGVSVNSDQWGKECFIILGSRLRKVYYDVELKCWGWFNDKYWNNRKLKQLVVYDGRNFKPSDQVQNIPTLVVNTERLTLPIVPKVPYHAIKLPKKIHFFVQDIDIEPYLERYKIFLGIIVHYDIDQALMPVFTRIIQRQVTFVWNNVKEDTSFFTFFHQSELGKYYEAARTSKYLDVAHDIMRYQIIKEKGGIFAPYRNVLLRPLLNAVKITKEGISLQYPKKRMIGNSYKYVLSNEIFASHINNPFFSKLNENIVNTLKENDGYFAKILNGKFLGAALFPRSEITGSLAFHRVVTENIPEYKALINYLNEEKTFFVFYREYEVAKNYFFPFPTA